MQPIKYFLLGVRLSPVFLLNGVCNLALGLFVLLVPPVDNGHPSWGLVNVTIALGVFYVVFRDGLRVTLAADTLEPSLDAASPRDRTRLLVGLRSYAQAHHIGNRRVAYIAGMTPDALDKWTLGATAKITDDEKAKVNHELQKLVELDVMFYQINKPKRIAFEVACVFAPALTGIISYCAGWPVLVGLLAPVPALGLYWWVVLRPSDPKRRRIRVVQDMVFGGHIPSEVKTAVSYLLSESDKLKDPV